MTGGISSPRLSALFTPRARTRVFMAASSILTLAPAYRSRCLRPLRRVGEYLAVSRPAASVSWKPDTLSSSALVRFSTRSARSASRVSIARAISSSTRPSSSKIGRAARATTRSGLAGKRWFIVRATTPPIRALKNRSGEKPASGGCKTMTRIAEMAAWLTSSTLSLNNTTVAIAMATTSAICGVPTPMASTVRSATNSPTATPRATSAARLPRCPNDTLNVTTAAMGAKNGCSLPSTDPARKYERPAASAVCEMDQPLARSRPAPARARCQALANKPSPVALPTPPTRPPAPCAQYTVPHPVHDEHDLSRTTRAASRPRRAAPRSARDHPPRLYRPLRLLQPVVEKRDAVAGLGDVREAVGRDLESSGVPGGVAVRRALVGTVHRLEGRRFGAGVEREERTQQNLPLVAFDGRLYVQPPRPGVELVGLTHGRASSTAVHAPRGSQGSAFHIPKAGDRGDLLYLELVVLVYVPRVPLARLVRVGPELVAAPGRNLAPRLLVVDAAERTVGPDLHPQQLVFQEGARVSRGARARAPRTRGSWVSTSTPTPSSPRTRSTSSCRATRGASAAARYTCSVWAATAPPGPARSSPASTASPISASANSLRAGTAPAPGTWTSPAPRATATASASLARPLWATPESEASCPAQRPGRPRSTRARPHWRHDPRLRHLRPQVKTSPRGRETGEGVASSPSPCPVLSARAGGIYTSVLSRTTFW